MRMRSACSSDIARKCVTLSQEGVWTSCGATRPFYRNKVVKEQRQFSNVAQLHITCRRKHNHHSSDDTSLMTHGAVSLSVCWRQPNLAPSHLTPIFIFAANRFTVVTGFS
eukprot:3039547-Prymnesium_polylepis.1